MTTDEFLIKLEQTPRDWKVSRSGKVRRFNSELNDMVCPLEEVLGVNKALLTTAHDMGLHEATLIMGAADFHRDKAELRARILKACGL